MQFFANSVSFYMGMFLRVILTLLLFAAACALADEWKNMK